MLKPVLPVVSDAFSHTFAEAIHISTVHAKYGSNHLAYDLAHAGCDDDSSKNQTTPKSEDPFPFHVSVNSSDYIFPCLKSKSSYSVFIQPTPPVIFISKHSPPPRLIIPRIV